MASAFIPGIFSNWNLLRLIFLREISIFLKALPETIISFYKVELKMN